MAMDLLPFCPLKKRPPTLPEQADGLTLKQPVAKVESGIL